jgi:hypothetical protein
VFLVHYKGAGALPLHIGFSTLPGPFTLLAAANREQRRGPDVEGRLQSGPKKLMHPHRIQPLLIARVEEVK